MILTPWYFTLPIFNYFSFQTICNKGEPKGRIDLKKEAMKWIWQNKKYLENEESLDLGAQKIENLFWNTEGFWF